MDKAEIDLGTIFYILIAVVAAITSIVQKKNKKADPANSPQPHETPKRTWEDVLTETFDIPHTKPQQPQTQPLTKPHETKTIKSPVIENSVIFSETYREKSSNEGFAMAFEENDIKLGEIGSTSETLAAKKVDFDLKKAVIYSEILNRKY